MMRIVLEMKTIKTGGTLNYKGQIFALTCHQTLPENREMASLLASYLLL